MSTPKSIEDRVTAAVDAWLRWLPTWQPGTHRGRSRMCRRCLGSPILQAAGVAGDVPHQVAHALVSRMQRIIDRAVDEYTARELPALHAELVGEQLWEPAGYDPAAGLDPEYEGLDLDPEAPSTEQPYLFTIADLVEQTRPEQPLPRPPLTAEEKRRVREDIERADQCAEETGRLICFLLIKHRPRTTLAVQKFVEPQIQQLLEQLARELEAPE